MEFIYWKYPASLTGFRREAFVQPCAQTATVRIIFNAASIVNHRPRFAHAFRRIIFNAASLGSSAVEGFPPAFQVIFNTASFGSGTAEKIPPADQLFPWFAFLISVPFPPEAILQYLHKETRVVPSSMLSPFTSIIEIGTLFLNGF
ncbi:hypothetical protein [Caldibacillus debilis]|uniref:hypothetical protein n=1 Tax=Caldibacillus debilis TaxID=301148 RepID=UPI0011C4A126|nr:hypothetical protein [Caldibacillus debilis]